MHSPGAFSLDLNLGLLSAEPEVFINAPPPVSAILPAGFDDKSNDIAIDSRRSREFERTKLLLKENGIHVHFGNVGFAQDSILLLLLVVEVDPSKSITAHVLGRFHPRTTNILVINSKFPRGKRIHAMR